MWPTLGRISSTLPWYQRPLSLLLFSALNIPLRHHGNAVLPDVLARALTVVTTSANATPRKTRVVRPSSVCRKKVPANTMARAPFIQRGSARTLPFRNAKMRRRVTALPVPV